MLGVRDVLSGLAMIVAPPGPALAVAVAARVASDLSDAASFQGLAPDAQARRKVALAAIGWATACAVTGVLALPRRQELVRTDPARRSVAVVGAGVAGLTAAYLLQRDVRRHALRGGAAPRRSRAHARRASPPTSDVLPIDSGFIVHNDRTYPNLLRLFGELGVETQPTDMSMSVRCDGCGLEYAGARGLGGVFADVRQRAQPALPPDARRGEAVPPPGACGCSTSRRPDRRALTLRRVPRRRAATRRYFAQPLHGARSSRACGRARRAPRSRYPARYLFPFLDHHGVLSVSGSPQWRTVVGGSRTYVERAAKELTATELSTPGAPASRRVADGVEIRDDGDDDPHASTVAVVATHADQALALLAEPTPAERASLGAFDVLGERDRAAHRRLAAAAQRRARASWNYLPRPLRQRRRPACRSATT